MPEHVKWILKHISSMKASGLNTCAEKEKQPLISGRPGIQESLWKTFLQLVLYSV